MSQDTVAVETGAGCMRIVPSLDMSVCPYHLLTCLCAPREGTNEQKSLSSKLHCPGVLPRGSSRNKPDIDLHEE